MAQILNQNQLKKQKNLIVFARMQSFWPTFKNIQQAGLLKDYLTLFLTSKVEANEYLNKYLADSKINAKILMYDALLILLKSKISGVSAHDVPDFGNLCQRVVDLYWYVSLSAEKLKCHGATLPSFFNPLQKFNDPTQSKHKVKNLRHEALLDLTAKLNSSLEKTFVSRKSFSFVRDVLDKLSEAAVKYADYLEDNKYFVDIYQTNDANDREQKIAELPFLEVNVKTAYPSAREANFVQLFSEKLESTDFFEPKPLELDSLHKGHHYNLIKHIKKKGLPFPNIVFFSCAFGPAVSGNIYYVWKEDLSDERHTERLKTINSTVECLPKYFSRSHKRRAREAMELIMEDKISPAQYHAIYRELIGDESVSDNQISKKINERYKLVLKVANSNVICDLRVHNHRKSSFDMFWKFTEQKIEELTAVNDRRHSETTENGNVIVNLTLALSVRDLYEKCKVYAIEKGITEENIL